MSDWNRNSDGMPLFLHVAIGVFIGTLAAAFVVWRFSIWQVQTAAAEMTEEVRRRAAQVAAQDQHQEEARRRAEAERRAALSQAERSAELARRQAADEAARHEAAWNRYYKKSLACDDQRGGAWSTDCANEYMRAKKRFEELYEAGKL